MSKKVLQFPKPTPERKYEDIILDELRKNAQARYEYILSLCKPLTKEEIKKSVLE